MKNKILLGLLLTTLFVAPISIVHSQVQGSAVFTKKLALGATGDQVAQLQDFLKQFPTIYPEGQVTSYFGPLTQAAVKRFQVQYGIEAIGVVGPITRARLNNLIVKGATGSAGATGATGSAGGVFVTGGGIGATGAAGTNGTNGNVGADGAAGAIGLTGDAGATGSTGANGTAGSTGAAGTNGTNGAAGATGSTGATGAMGPIGVMSSALYVQYGSQPATVGAGQPFTYTTTIFSTSSITSATALFNPPFTVSGTVFTLANIGRYEVQYQMTYPADGGVVIYLGSSMANMAALPYTMIGKIPDSQISGSFIIQTTTTNSFVSINAAPGNSTAIGIPPNSNTTNQSATTVSFKQIQ